MNTQYTIKVNKEYFNFAAAHFMVFADGTREFLHGHNYRVEVIGRHGKLVDDMVIDFLKLKPIVKKICDRLDHRLLLPEKNPHLKIEFHDKQIQLYLSSGDKFSFPQNDVLILPTENISAERLAIYLSHQLEIELKEQYNFQFAELTLEVEESKGQSAAYTIISEK